MKRYPFKFKQPTYQEIDFYECTPIARKAVAPGDRVSALTVDCRFVTSVYDKVLLNPVLVQTWAFYIPNRLVWDNWVDFIALDENFPSVPRAGVNSAARYFEGVSTGSGVSSLFRRGCKLAYNQYFGDEAFASSNAWFADITDDTKTGVGRLLIWDQFRSAMKQGSYASDTYLASVSGSTATIVLDDLQAALRDSRAKRRQFAVGDKYVDTMRLMGVELDWRVQMAPEYLGSSQQVLYGRTTQATDSTDLQSRVTSWDGRHRMALNKRFSFAEHGSLVVFMGFRPLMCLSSASAPDAYMVDWDDYFRADANSGPFEPGSGGSKVERYWAYRRGRGASGVTDNDNAFFDTGAEYDLYPSPALFVPITGSGPRAVSVMTDFTVSGLTAVAPSGA